MWISLLVLLSWLLVTPAWAAPPTKLLWDRNTEIDMLEYGVYSCSSSAVCVPNTKIGTVPQPAIGSIPEFALPVNTQGRVGVIAVDLVGNESGQSNVVSYDKQSPPNPQNLRAQ